MTQPHEYSPRFIETAHQRLALLISGSSRPIEAADYVELAPDLHLCLPHVEAEALRLNDPHCRLVRAVLATTKPGYASLLVHGDAPQPDPRLFYGFPTEPKAKALAWLEEQDVPTVRLWTNAARLSELQQTSNDPDEMLHRKLDQGLAPAYPVTDQGAALPLGAPGVLPEDAAGLEEMLRLFVPEEHDHPKAFYAENPELYYRTRREHVLRAAGNVGLTLATVTAAVLWWKVAAEQPPPTDNTLGAQLASSQYWQRASATTSVSLAALSAAFAAKWFGNAIAMGKNRPSPDFLPGRRSASAGAQGKPAKKSKGANR